MGPVRLRRIECYSLRYEKTDTKGLRPKWNTFQQEERNEFTQDLRAFCSYGRSSLDSAAPLLLSRIEGNGTFAETAKRISESERLYRVVLSSAVNVPLSAALLAFALYVTLKPVNSFLAQLAMIFNLLVSSLGCVVRIC